MGSVVVVGSQWGDEGKGKIVDWLSERADVIVRFQGGHNAGHTLVIDGVVYKLSLLPSGVVRPGKLSVIGNGVVLDPVALQAEIAAMQARRASTVTPASLKVAETVPLILSVHRELDRLREAASGVGCDRHHRARHRPGLRGQGRPPCDPPVRTSTTTTALPSRIDRLACPSQRAARRPRRGAGDRRRTIHARSLPPPAPLLVFADADLAHALREARRAGQATSSSRARRARCSTSTTAPIRS